ncbi:MULTISPECIES: hypothetical protein [Chryseobacterium]|uniref:hypothetical protein n=1 Tax=Chryseobacterium TaxID=59732 RepID=UPI0016244C41|nr:MULTISPECIES: hypothetical protein [Chryseobacterium]MDM1555177.1 hypothetical protein [Chryseobacterium indologenes]
MKKISLIIAAVVFLIVVLYYNFGGLDIYLLNKMNRSALPEKYKNYLNIDSTKAITFGHHKIQLMWESHSRIQHFLSSDGNVIIVTNEIPKDRNRKEVEEDGEVGSTRFYMDYHFYKLDKDGNIVDYYTYKSTRGNWNELLFGDYIVNYNKKYYKTWIKDGDTVRKAMIIQNENLKWNREEQMKQYRNIVENAEDYLREDQDDSERITYFMQGKWYQLYTDTTLTPGIYSRANPGYNNSLFDEGLSKKKELAPNRFPNILPVYFQRKVLNKFTTNASGGGISSTLKSWNGDLYCQLIVRRDTLKFKKAMSFNEIFTTEKFYHAKGEDIRKLKAELEKEYVPYLYFSDKNLNFQLFTTDQNKLYIIKPVQ